MIKRILILAAIVLGLSYAAFTRVVHRDFVYQMELITDTLADTASGDGKSNEADTIGLFRPFEWNSFMFHATIKAPPASGIGIGAALDSVYWRLVRQYWGTTVIIASESAGIPDTFTYMVSGANDTVVRGDWKLIVLTVDTATSARVVTSYPIVIDWEALPVEQ